MRADCLSSPFFRCACAAPIGGGIVAAAATGSSKSPQYAASGVRFFTAARTASTLGGSVPEGTSILINAGCDTPPAIPNDAGLITTLTRRRTTGLCAT